VKKWEWCYRLRGYLNVSLSTHVLIIILELSPYFDRRM